MISIPTYPARPSNGGRFDLAPAKLGKWRYEPKANGRRGILHLPSGELWNRHGERASIGPETEFPKAFEQLKQAFGWKDIWLDVEILYGRIPLGKGSVCILDIMPAKGAPYGGYNYLDRRAMLEWNLPQMGDDLCLIFNDYAFRLPSTENGKQMWEQTQAANKILGHDMWEGLVAKRADSYYPINLLNPDRAYPYWVKHKYIP